VPLASAYRQRTADGARLTADIEDWHTLLKQHWDKLYFGNVTSGMCAEGYCFQVQVYLDGISPEAVSVELYADALGAWEQLRHPLARTASLVGGEQRILVHRHRPSRPPRDALYAARCPGTFRGQHAAGSVFDYMVQMTVGLGGNMSAIMLRNAGEFKCDCLLTGWLLQ